MNLIQKFDLNHKTKLELLIPDAKDKFNYFNEITNELHMADQIFISFSHKEEKLIVGQDMIDMVLESFQEALAGALSNNLNIDIQPGTVGHYYNMWVQHEWPDRIPLGADVCRHDEVMVWMYNHAGKIYLEIFPRYPWLYVEQEEAEHDKDYVSFDEFIKNYKPIYVSEISQAIAKQWLVLCDELDKKINKRPPQKRGLKFKRGTPRDGQDALNNSLLLVEADVPIRIAISNHEFVVLNEHAPRVFYGHVRLWQDLSNKMKKTLIQAGLVNTKGRIYEGT